MLKYYIWQTRTRSGVICVSDCIQRTDVMEFLENFNGEYLTHITRENDYNNGSAFHITCNRKAERIATGLCMIQYTTEQGETRTTGAQISAHTNVVVMHSVPTKPRKPKRHRKNPDADYRENWGRIKPLAYVDWFGRKPEKNY